MGDGIDQTRTAPGRLVEKLLLRKGYSLLRLDGMEGEEVAQGVVLKEVRIRLPRQPGEETLVVIKGVARGTPVVGFHSSMEPSDALHGAIERVMNGTMVWRGDQYAGES